MRLLRVLPAVLLEYATAVPSVCACAHESTYVFFIVPFSVEPGHALKSPAMMRGSARPLAHDVSSPISSSRSDEESASRCVDVKLIDRPLTWMTTLTAARLWLKRRTSVESNGKRDRIRLPLPLADPVA